MRFMENTKVPLGNMTQPWAEPNDSALMAEWNKSGAPATSGNKASPTIITSGSTGYDGTTDPGKPE